MPGQGVEVRDEFWILTTFAGTVGFIGKVSSVSQENSLNMKVQLPGFKLARGTKCTKTSFAYISIDQLEPFLPDTWTF